MTQRANELLAAGDIEGRAVWLRILAAVNELMATKATGAVHRALGASRDVAALLRSYPSEAMRAYRVSTAVNHVRNDGPECVEPAA